jgi:DNA-binding MarR family transcriptional regulator
MNRNYENRPVGTEPEVISEKIFLNLVRISQLYRKTLNSSNESFELSPNELGLMMIMYLDPTINTANQIVKVLGTTKGLASRNIENLRSKELLVTNQDEKDRRVVRLTLCSKAKEICEEIRRKNMSLFRKAMEGIELKDAISALEILQKMVTNIE